MASLPGLPRPPEINRLLITLAELDAGDGVAKSALFEGMSSVCLGGELPDNERTLAFGELTGIVKRRGGRWRITESGFALLAANPGRAYELPEAERGLIAEVCVLHGPYAAPAEEIMGRFRIRSDADTWVLDGSQGGKLDLAQRSLVSFMLALGVLRASDAGIEVAAEHVSTASWLRSGRLLSLQQLSEILERQRTQGARAEQWVVHHERQRLEGAGHAAEARAVRQVSLVDVCAGYDVGSFDGASSTLIHDRFIEVKRTASVSSVFFWSANELAVAKRLGRRYWLYLLAYAGEVPTSLVQLADPASKLLRRGVLTLEPSAYRCRVSERVRKVTL